MNNPTLVNWHPAEITGDVWAHGFSRWKRAAIRISFPNARVHFVDRWPELHHGATVAVWGLADVPYAAHTDAWQVIRIEDGFLRSVGLGADLIRPVSWVFDPAGIYYDPRTPSRLEAILQAGIKDPELCQRARRLQETILLSGLTKYNVGSADWNPPQSTGRIILVVGQVESDASLAVGAGPISTNWDLLQQVRTECDSGDYLIYKPHPDVVARLRAEGADEHRADTLADEVIVDLDMSQLLPRVDEVHVMTSLAGFEALLRGRKVVCHGQPFFSGWGLTDDRCPPPRRHRRLTLDELVAGTLIMYPVYFDWDKKVLTTPESATQVLLAEKRRTGGKLPWWRRGMRVILRYVVGVR